MYKDRGLYCEFRKFYNPKKGVFKTFYPVLDDVIIFNDTEYLNQFKPSNKVIRPKYSDSTSIMDIGQLFVAVRRMSPFILYVQEVLPIFI